MITTDDIMALVRCRDPAHLQQRLEEAVADLAAERDAKTKQIRTLIRELDIACKQSLKAEAERDALKAENFSLAAGQCIHDDGLTANEGGTPYCAIKAERDALLAEVMLWSHRAGEDFAQHRKTIEERDALKAALRAVIAWTQDGASYHMGQGCYDIAVAALKETT